MHLVLATTSHSPVYTPAPEYPLLITGNRLVVELRLQLRSVHVMVVALGRVMRGRLGLARRVVGANTGLGLGRFLQGYMYHLFICMVWTVRNMVMVEYGNGSI